jgi:hypothetical protein
MMRTGPENLGSWYRKHYWCCNVRHLLSRAHASTTCNLCCFIDGLHTLHEGKHYLSSHLA